jgi:hypothetical protein
LDTHNVKPLAAANVLATHWIVSPHHVALCLGKASAVAVICTPGELRLLSPHDPLNLVIPLLPTVWTGHYMRSLFRPLVKKVALFHPAPHPAFDRFYQPNPNCNPASDAPLQARVMHNHARATKPGMNAEKEAG